MAEPPLIDNFIDIVQKCRKKRILAYARHVHAHICNNGLESHRTLGNYIVPMFVECGSVSDAQGVFNKLVYRNVHSWTALILGYIECGKLHHALDLYQKMQEDNVHPSSYTFIAVLKACSRLRDVETGREIHFKVTQTGLETDAFVGSALVSMYVKCGLVAEAKEFFDKLPIRNVVSWTALMGGYAEHGPCEEALKCFEQMELEGISPNSVTFVSVLKACGSIGAIDKGRQLHSDLAQKGFERDVFVGSTLVDMYAKCGSLAEAREVFEKLPVQNVVSCTALIAGYAEHGLGQEALKIFEQMQLEGVSPNAITFVCVLKACGSIGAIDKGREIHVDILQEELERDVFVGSTLVDMYAKCGSIADAWEVFEKLPVQNVVSWNAIIAGYAENGPGQEALKCFEQMQWEGISPDAVTYMGVLKACGNTRAIDKGREIHLEVAQRGFKQDAFVGNTLLDMYARCGSLVEAQEIFDNLPVRSVVSWNALIAGYAEHGPCHEVLKCFEEMQLQGVAPNAATYVCVLKACGSIGAIDMGREIHTEITRKGFERDLFVGNTLVDLYARCGSLAEAWEILDSLPVRDVVTWNALIAGHAEHGPGQEALECFEQMQLEGVSPDSITFVYVLKACGSIGDLSEGQRMHTDIAQRGLEIDHCVGNTLVDMYTKCGSLADAQEVFDKLPVRNVVSWTALIAGYAEQGPGQEALECFERMQLERVFPDAITFVCVLKACGSTGAADKGHKIHADVVQKGFERDTFVGNTLVDMYGKCGSLVDAHEVFKKLPVQNVVSWNALIAGYADHGPGEEALKCFEQMQLQGVSPDAVTFVCILKVCSSIGDIEKGRVMQADIALKGFEKDVIVGNTLVDMYTKCGLLAEAQEVFDNLTIPNVVSWNTLIAGYAEYGPGQEALKCFEQMQLEGISPDAATFVCVLKACGSMGAIDKGREIQAEIDQKGLQRDLSVGNTLVDMYAKCGSLSEAQEVFTKLPVRGVVSWNAMIKGYALNLQGSMAIQCFEDMQEEGVKPDSITFTCLLTACSRSRLVFKGQELFNVMRKEHGITPTIDHYICMIDLLAKSGHLYEAEKFVETMPCPPLWMALLSACKIYGEAELGLRCFQLLVQINPECAAPYVLMAKIYASAGMWDDADRIEELRKRAGAKKMPASALIEVNNSMHEFVVGIDHNKDISAMLDILSSRMKEVGHVPSLLESHF